MSPEELDKELEIIDVTLVHYHKVLEQLQLLDDPYGKRYERAIIEAERGIRRMESFRKSNLWKQNWLKERSQATIEEANEALEHKNNPYGRRQSAIDRILGLSDKPKKTE